MRGEGNGGNGGPKERIREKLSGFRPYRSRVAYCCDIMHHYGGLLVARDGPSAPRDAGRWPGGGEGVAILVLRARLADFHGQRWVS